MKSRKLYFISMTIMILALASILVHWFLIRFPDWLVRAIGLLILADTALLVFSTVKLLQAKRKPKE